MEGHPVVRAVWFRASPDQARFAVHVVARTSHSVVVHLDAGDLAVEHRWLGVRSKATPSAAAVGFVCHPWTDPRTVERLTGTARRRRPTWLRSGAGAMVAGVLASCAGAEANAEIRRALLSIEFDPTRQGLRAATSASSLSERTIRRRFQATLGLSPDRFRIIARAATARDVLLADDAPLADVAHRTGYADQSHLHREFVELCGYTPAEWRRRSSDWDLSHHSGAHLGDDHRIAGRTKPPETSC